MRTTSLLVALAALTALSPMTAASRTLEVGQGKAYALPSAAIAAAGPGDVVSIHPGQYFDCAVTGQGNLVIEGVGDPGEVVMTDKTCQGKAILVLGGNGVVVRNITLARARVPDGNGAGIRLEGGDLYVAHVRFENDQVGILSGATGGTVSISDSWFADGGVGGEQPKYQVMVGESTRLLIASCVFSGVAGGMVSSGAGNANLSGNEFRVGGATPSQTIPIAVGDGLMLLQRNEFRTSGATVPVAMVAVRDQAMAIATRNRITGDATTPVALMQGWSRTDPEGHDNELRPGDRLVTNDGAWRHRASTAYHDARQGMHDAVRWLWHQAKAARNAL